MNKKFVFFVLFIFLIIVIGLIFGISTIYRFSIVKDISRKIEDNLKKDNYHMLTSVTDFDGNKVLAYEHHSLRLNQVPKPQEILPSFFEPVVIPKKKSHTIE